MSTSRWLEDLNRWGRALWQGCGRGSRAWQSPRGVEKPASRIQPGPRIGEGDLQRPRLRHYPKPHSCGPAWPVASIKGASTCALELQQKGSCRANQQTRQAASNQPGKNNQQRKHDLNNAEITVELLG